MNEAKRQNDTGLLEVLAVVREELDEVEEKLIDPLNDMMDAARDKMEEEEKDEGDEWDDEKMLIDSLPGMTDAERDEMEEKGEDIEKQQAKKNEKAGIGSCGVCSQGHTQASLRAPAPVQERHTQLEGCCQLSRAH
jgi:hypothetical protein